MDLKKLFNADVEELAQQAASLTRQYFGKAISLYAPLYLSSYCENNCLYCGFNADQKIERKKLNMEEIDHECRSLSKTGIQNLLLLTGESRSKTPPEYLRNAVQIAKRYFPYVSLEVYSLEEDEYRMLFNAGVDGVTVYQETYDRDIYDKIHIFGKKKDYNYRYNTPERIAKSGIRHISLGVLLGLAPWKEDVSALFEHLEWLLKAYPGVEYSLSFPRIQKLTDWEYQHDSISDVDMVKIICAARILFPRVDINISTRESEGFRNNILPLGVTRMSAGSLTTVGGYSGESSNSEQFSINDERNLDDIKGMLKKRGFDPVLTSWRSIDNKS